MSEGELLALYSGPIKRAAIMASRKCGLRDWEDTRQTAVVELLLAEDRVLDAGAFCYGVCRYVSTKEFTRRSRLASESYIAHASCSGKQENVIAADSAEKLLDGVRKRLPARYRRMLDMYLAEMSDREIRITVGAGSEGVWRNLRHRFKVAAVQAAREAAI